MKMLVLLSIFLLGASLFIINTLGEEKPAFLSKFHQNDYKIKIEWAEVVRFDKRYMKRLELWIFKRTRNCTAANVTFEENIDFGNELEIVIQAYKFTRSNDYRLFPLRFEVNYCQAIALDLAGIRSSLACGNFTGCPLKKGKITRVCNWTPDENQFPPFIPNGRYQIEMQALYRSSEAWVANIYGEVYRPIVKK